MTDLFYLWSLDGGFIIRFCEVEQLYKLYEVPIFRGDEQYIGNFISIDAAKQFADNLF
jgi:hypothetical protein